MVNRNRSFGSDIPKDTRFKSICNSVQLTEHFQKAFHDKNWLSQLIVHINSYSNPQEALYIFKQAIDNKILQYVNESFGSLDPNYS